MKDLCAGPGRLCEALGITGAMNGESLAGDRICILASGAGRRGRIHASERIGITKAADWPLRFSLGDSTWLSRRVRLKTKRRPVVD